MTTPEEALTTARRYVATQRRGVHVVALLEDVSDYFAVLSLDDLRFGWELGPGPVFVSKATGEVWSDAYGNILDKIDAMKPA